MSTPADPKIVCPPWCDIAMADHVDDLRKNNEPTDPIVIHQGAAIAGHPDWILTSSQRPNGTPVPERPGYAPVMLMDGDDVVHPDDAETLARAVLELVELARNGPHKIAWWRSARNPSCRPWCTTDHNPDVFADGALISCRAYVDHDLAVIDAIEINACTRADETISAQPGDLIFDPPEIEVFMMTDDRDGDVTTPEGLEAMAAQLPALLAEARAIAASDPHATDEQKEFAR